MFLFIPLLLILTSAGGIVFIVWRKLPRLKELAEAENSDGTLSAPQTDLKTEPLTRYGVDANLKWTATNNFLKSGWHILAYDLCPEIWNWARGIKVKEYKEMWLIEAEKLLRRLRLASLKMDRFSDSLIKKIRKHTYPENGSAFSATETEIIKDKKDKQDMGLKTDDEAMLKKNEQRLIIEIASNPKSAALYEELGDLYAKMGDYRDAKESYEAAIELNSNNEELKKKLLRTLEALNPQS